MHGSDGLTLPHSVRSAVESIVGGPVVEAHSQAGGYSPGCADRVITAGGLRAFVKAVSGSLNQAELRRVFASCEREQVNAVLAGLAG